MWRIWLLFDPRRALIGVAIFLFSLAILIHFILLSSNKYGWIEGSHPAAAAAHQAAPLPSSSN